MFEQVGIPTKARAGFLRGGLGTMRSASLGFENGGYLLAGLLCESDAKRNTFRRIKTRSDMFG